MLIALFNIADLLLRLLGWIIKPVLWLFDALMRMLESGYPRLIRWSLRNRVIVYGLVLAGGAARGAARPGAGHPHVMVV